MFYQETLQRNGPQVGIYESGDIPNAILTEKYVFILTVGVLPDLEKDSYENADGETYKWYNDEYKVGNIRFYLFFCPFYFPIFSFYFSESWRWMKDFFYLNKFRVGVSLKTR